MLSGALFAQSSAAKANRNTATRCLKLAENCLVSQDWTNAFNQAELGLSYDDSISDLYYVKAAATVNLGTSKKEVIEIVTEAFAKNNWIDYTKNGARILLADLYCDTGKYAESLSMLDQEPLIYSADAELIRIKNLYRIGTEDTLNQARLKVNSSRRVYSTDARFPNVFFAFEALIKEACELYYGEYEIPALVKTIANSYIIKLPDYTGEKTELELLASIFADEEVKTRLIRAIDAKNQTHDPLLALCGLRAGIYTQRQAYEKFFNWSGDFVYLIYLDYLASVITDEDVKMDLLAKMVNFDGTLLIDENMDLQYELKVKYELGRPKSITYDSDDDGKRELYSVCDYGAPQFVYFDDSKIQLFYDVFPQVQKVTFNESNAVFNFLYDDFVYSPFAMQTDSVFLSYDLEFFIPVSTHQPVDFDFTVLSEKCSSLELPITERENGKIVYTMLKGTPVFAKFYEGETQYAYCDFEEGIPFVRFADYDFDGNFETTEIYDFINPNDASASIGAASEESLRDPAFISSVFSDISSFDNVYLKKIRIDRNANTFFEYIQEFLPNNGTVTLWDDNDDGITDCRHTKLYSTDGQNVSEETVFYDSEGYDFVTVVSLNSIPVKLTYNGQDSIIFAGDNKHFYWINEVGTEADEKLALGFSGNGLEQGSVDIISAEGKSILIIKVGENYFCHIVKDDYYDLDAVTVVE